MIDKIEKGITTLIIPFQRSRADSFGITNLLITNLK